ncbi:hypothetical protein RhiirA5_437713 [Rhizophagus irregularis]|uniref:Uncharacterized protein n=1 Tax=Rhizophagus irregularis TaxID=588596 RepID=A0A2N0NK50_9GLOM|nr:hypothetical protein RhiirA5_438052 [Rhizophagus irregularis]PKB94943.1 hypothetical protein RhiirA5_437713 [Rhizophagus irregularis]
MNYLQDVAKKNYTFEYGKLVHFGKQTVYLAYFKDKDQLNVAMAFDENKDRASWQGALMSLRLTNNNKGKSVRAKDPPIVTPGTHANGSEHLETDEVVGNINKFCKNLLDKNLSPRKSLPIKEYTTLEEVSNVMKEWRNFEFICGKPLKTPEEIKEAKERENKDWEKWLSHFEKKKPTTKDDEREENLVKKEGVSIKPVTPHECNTVNASCLTRLSCDNLQIKEEKNSESDEGCVKEGKKRILGKQGDRSIAEEHDSDGSWTTVTWKTERKRYLRKPRSRIKLKLE